MILFILWMTGFGLLSQFFSSFWFSSNYRNQKTQNFLRQTSWWSARSRRQSVSFVLKAFTGLLYDCGNPNLWIWRTWNGSLKAYSTIVWYLHTFTLFTRKIHVNYYTFSSIFPVKTTWVEYACSSHLIFLYYFL